MAFNDIPKIEDNDFYIEIAFKKAREKADRMRGSYISEDKLKISKQLESAKVKTVMNELSDRLFFILKTYPDLDDLHEFYRELIRTTIDWVVLKKSLGAVNWARKIIVDQGIQTNHKINRSSYGASMNKLRREYYGRCVSVMKQIKKNLLFLENARKVMRKYPMIKTGLETVAIVGFPNVGKTTLLYKLTGSKAEINEYAFTTKGVNVGYIAKEKKKEESSLKPKRSSIESQAEFGKKRRNKIQLLDTPGTLNRPEKMNDIERVAFLALSLLAEKAVYVFDLTEPFPLKDQIALYNEVKKLKLPMLVYVSKSDITPKETYEPFAKKYNATVSIEELTAFLQE